MRLRAHRKILAAAAGAMSLAAASVAAPDYTLRVVNAKDGPIQVRLGDEGPWATLGHVLVPANRTAAGFGAARWSRRASVAATAVHGIRVKVGEGEFPSMLSFVPREFTKIPDFYGGHIPGDSGIRTDIRSGVSLFRDWAPLAGSPVRLEVAGGSLDLPTDYAPAAGDVLLISVTFPRDAPRHIVFENRKGGAVTAVSPTGQGRPLGTVAQPVRGVGRFDGTSYTGVGAINTNHPGVITVATAPAVATDKDEGAPPERRGGFMISPSTHVADQAKGMPQVLSVAPLGNEPPWEGRYPLFGGAIGLRRDVADPSAGFQVEMRVDNGPWEPLPTMLGRQDDAFTAAGLARMWNAKGVKRETTQGATAFRLTLPAWDEEAARARFAATRKNAPPARPEPTGVYQRVQGQTPVRVTGNVSAVTFLVDGAVRAASNTPGYEWLWDTTREANGRHWLEIVQRDAFGETRRLRRVLVQNPAPSPAAP